jgi:hypothetical protein
VRLKNVLYGFCFGFLGDELGFRILFKCFRIRDNVPDVVANAPDDK